MGHLANQLRDVSDLKAKGLLDQAEYQAEKEQLLAFSLRSTDLRTGLERLAELQKTNILTATEFKTLKAKILEIGK